jgi:tetratricopeptide (TPR) repeat protein
MMKRTILVFGFISILLFFSSSKSFSQDYFSDKDNPIVDNDMGELSLDMSKIDLDAFSYQYEDRRQYLIKIQQEKERVQQSMLEGIYDQAYRLYKTGDYKRAGQLCQKILTIEPEYEQARKLLEETERIEKEKNSDFKRAQIEDKFVEGVNAYKLGDYELAVKHWEEMSLLSENNTENVRGWLKRSEADLSEKQLDECLENYQAGNLTDALNLCYGGMLLNPEDKRISSLLAKVETANRNEIANQKLKQAVSLYSSGKLQAALGLLNDTLEVRPGDSRIHKLAYEIRTEIGERHIARGKTFYSKRQYDNAVSEWQKARQYYNDQDYISTLIARANTQKKREAEFKRKKEEEARKKAIEAAEAERKKREEEARKKMEEELSTSETESEVKKLPSSGPVTEENRRAAQQYYLQGLSHFNNGDFEQARSKFEIALQYDPEHTDAKVGLQRIEQMASVSQ